MNTKAHIGRAVPANAKRYSRVQVESAHVAVREQRPKDNVVKTWRIRAITGHVVFGRIGHIPFVGAGEPYCGQTAIPVAPG